MSMSMSKSDASMLESLIEKRMVCELAARICTAERDEAIRKLANFVEQLQAKNQPDRLPL